MASYNIQYAKKLDFEKAQEIKEKLQVLEEFHGKSIVISSVSGNYDVFSVVSDQNYAYVNYMKVVDGALINVHTREIKKKLNETDKEILIYAIPEIVNSQQSGFDEIKEIILPFDVEYNFFNIKITIPKIGDKKKLIFSDCQVFPDVYIM